MKSLGAAESSFGVATIQWDDLETPTSKAEIYLKSTNLDTSTKLLQILSLNHMMPINQLDGHSVHYHSVDHTVKCDILFHISFQHASNNNKVIIILKKLQVKCCEMFDKFVCI